MPNPTGINQYNKTNGNVYLPTPAEQKLLEVLCNPNSLGKTVTAICIEAGVERKVYYDAIKKEGFYELRNKFLMDIIKAGVGDILQATIKYGKESSKNSQDRKMILTMAGIYTDKIESNVNETVTIKVKKPDLLGLE
jgi:hypothetical protein